ncbi:MAG: ABC transporter permease [Thermodesulfobacteriota bacterium]
MSNKALERTRKGEIPPRAEGKAPGTILKTLLVKIFRPRTLGLVSVIVVWQITSLVSPEDTLASPYLVFRAVIFEVILRERFFLHVGATLLRIIVGFGIAFSIGASMGVLMGTMKYWEKFFSDYVTVGLTIPSLAGAVIGVLWLGIRFLTPSFSVVMIATPYVAVNIWEGVKDVDKDLVDMGRAFDVSRRRIIKNIYIPSLLPFVFAAARIGFSVSWKLVVLAEVFGSDEGIGYMIFYWYQMFDMELVLAWVLLFAFIMFYIEYGIIRRLQRRFLGWRPEVIL